ncbi:ArpU family transcriptional regulator [Bacillus thuringiensis]
MRRRVIKELKYYKALRVRVQNRQERVEAGYAVQEEGDHEIRFKQIERALLFALDEDERRIIEMKYLSNKKVKDTYVYNELMINRDPYYEKKGSAIRLIATALEII